MAAKASRSKKPKAKVTRRAAAKPKARKVKPIPDGYPPLIPVTTVSPCSKAIAFYASVFGGKERMRMPMPDGSIAHAEMTFGPAVLMLADPMPGFPVSPARFCLYAKDCDAVYRTAVKAGAVSKQEPADQFYGDRSARVVDPFGNEWTIMTHVEDVSAKEMKKRMAAMSGPQ